MEPGLILNGRYKLERLLGTGGMGEVWQTWDKNLERWVALKRIKPEYMDDRGHIDMFMAEAKQTANLTHPRIVPVHDRFESGGSLWMSMAYIQGKNLAQALASGRLSFTARETALRDVLEGLVYLHGEGGTLHRDIKPANILLDEGNRAYITDFGIARPSQRTGNTATQPGVVGTPGYIADEVMLGAPASPASDVWAFGAVALQTFAGVLPEAGAPAHDFAGAFTPMIRDALNPAPAKRPTAKQLLTGWEKAIAATSSHAEASTVAQSIVATPPAPGGGPKRRGRTAAFALAGLGLAAIIGIPTAISAVTGGGGDPAAVESETSSSTPTPSVTATPSQTTTPTPTPTPTISASQQSSPPVTPANLGPKTYNLVDVKHTNNSYYEFPADTTIGTKPFSNSLKAVAHETNTITYGLGGACTQLKVSVGQNAFSPRQGAPITFSVFLNDHEAAKATLGPYEEAQELVVDLTGVVVLKLADNRTPKDGQSVWGSPVLICSHNPAPVNR